MRYFVFSGLALGSSSLLASAGGGSGAVVDVYSWLAHALHVDEFFLPAFSAVLSVPLLLVIGLIYRSRAMGMVQSGSVVPGGKMSFFSGLDMVMEFLLSLSKDTCGKAALSFFPFLSTLFLFILLNNVSGLIPGFPPSTGSFSMNLALGLVAFVVYNVAGMWEHGVAYAKQFMGPLLLLAPFLFCLELVSHCTRPLTLAFRLTANVFGDHLLLSVFGDLAPLLVPIALLFFGLLVACVQSFVFTLLTGIYISMAISHDH